MIKMEEEKKKERRVRWHRVPFLSGRGLNSSKNPHATSCAARASSSAIILRMNDGRAGAAATHKRQRMTGGQSTFQSTSKLPTDHSTFEITLFKHGHTYKYMARMRPLTSHMHAYAYYSTFSYVSISSRLFFPSLSVSFQFESAKYTQEWPLA